MSRNNIEKQLKKVCDENEEYKELYSTWILDKEAISQVISNVPKDYPYYSRHDESHSENILSNIEKILGDTGIEKLSPTDLWIILHVAYFHDSGMVTPDISIKELWKSDKFKDFLDKCKSDEDKSVQKAAKLLTAFNPDNKESYEWALDIKKSVVLISSKYFRPQHGDISETSINHSDIWGIDLSHNGLIQRRLVKLTGAICALHMKDFNDVMKLHKMSNGFKTDYVHPRFIACLLRLGDLLDLDNGRFNPFVEKMYGPMPKVSTIHRDKHESTTHILVTPKIIEVEADCNTDEVYREIIYWLNMLKNEIKELQLNWNNIAPDEFERAPQLAEPRVLINGKPDEWGFAKLKMEISQAKAFELIQGASFYKDKFICLRELVQNAEDASKIQLWRDIKVGKYYSMGIIEREKVESGTLMPYDIPSWIYDIYTIRVEIENDEDYTVVRITDKGIGISPEKLKRICNVGGSYYVMKSEKDEIDGMPLWLRPTGSFGIGLQSCFLLTDKFTMETKAEGEQAMLITFSSPVKNDYPLVKNINSACCGTTVELRVPIKEDFTFSLGGFAYRNLMNADPFKSKATVIYKIVEAISENCNNSLFAIDLKSETLSLNETIDKIDNKASKDWEESSDIYWRFAESPQNMVCWYNGNQYTINLRNRPEDTAVRIFFKGKIIKNHDKLMTRIFNGIHIDIDIYGRKTETTLTLNRDDLKYDAAKEIYDDLNKILNHYFSVIPNQIGSLNDDYPFCNYVLCAEIYGDNINTKSIREKINNNNDITFTALIKKSEGKYTVKENVHFSDIVDHYPYLSYIDRRVVRQKSEQIYPDAIEQKELTKYVNAAKDNINSNYIIIDENLTVLLKKKPATIQYIPCDEQGDICLYTPVKNHFFIKDKYTKEKLIKSLVYYPGLHVRQNIFQQRMCIPAIKGYENLAVKKPEQMLGYIEKSSCYIISPITREYENNHSTADEKTYIDGIINSPEFKNLVEYVYENSICPSTTDKISEDYEKLIKVYYHCKHNKV